MSIRQSGSILTGFEEEEEWDEDSDDWEDDTDEIGEDDEEQ